MFLTRLPRPLGLLVVFVAAFTVAILLGTFTAFLPFFLVNAIDDDIRGYRPFIEFMRESISFTSLRVPFLVGSAAYWAGFQALFLAPIVGKLKANAQPRSLLPSVVATTMIGSLGCALLWVSLIEWALLPLLETWESSSKSPRSLLAIVYLSGLLMWILSGFIWYRLLLRVGHIRNPAGLDRFLRWIFAGTCVELVLGVGALLSLRRKTSCECATVSGLLLAFGSLTLLWMCGPFVVLLLTRNERLQWSRAACLQCGMPRRTDTEACQECAAPHRAQGS